MSLLPDSLLPDSSDTSLFASLGGSVRDAAFLAVESEIRRLQALQSAMLGEVDRSLSFVDDGHASSRAWVQAVTNCSRSTAARRVTEARLLHSMPLLASAAAAGEIGSDQLRQLGDLFRNDRCRSQLSDSDELLTALAKSLTLREFATVCQRWQAHADPDGAHRDHQLSRKNRSVTFSTLGAGFRLAAEGDAASGDDMWEILEAHVQAEFETDVAQRAELYGDAAQSFPLARTASQRRFDALQTVFNKAAGTNRDGLVERVVNLFTTPETLQHEIRNHVGHTVGALPSAACVSPLLPRSETASGTPVDPADLVAAALAGQIRRVVVDSAGRVLDLGRKQRLFTGAAREAVKLAGDRCVWPGCDIRGPSIQIDHLQGFAKGGSTNPGNGGPLCPAHNRSKERVRVTVFRNETGWHFYRRDGTESRPELDSACLYGVVPKRISSMLDCRSLIGTVTCRAGAPLRLPINRLASRTGKAVD